MPAASSWDVFCRVVDNYGDAAVCWRLARALAALGARTRLWIDHLGALRALQPHIDADAPFQSVGAVEICRWTGDASFGAPADVAIDAFGAGIPEAYARALAARRPRAIWIVLEYLSAEPWVASHHGLPSPHPRLPVGRWFFFPGFGAGTGGLLREADLEGRRESFLARPASSEALWREAGFPPPAPGAQVISLFGYGNPRVTELLECWACGAREVVAAVAESPLAANIAAWFGADGGERAPLRGRSLRRGALEARFIPFLAHERYDELLWASDWNFVRGEDSFVRAQWAEHPLVWHAYPQSGGAHRAKVECFLAAYCARLAPGPAEALKILWRGWNDPDGAAAVSLERAWTALAADYDALDRHARRWAAEAAQTGDLAANLAKFCSERL